MLHNSQNLFTLEDFYDLNSEKKGEKERRFQEKIRFFKVKKPTIYDLRVFLFSAPPPAWYLDIFSPK